LRLSFRFVAPVVVGFTAIAAFLVRLGLRAQRQPAFSGAAGMIGLAGQAVTLIGPGAAGQVRVRGELWRAESSVPIPPGSGVIIVGLRGLTLTVRST
jgi:membrane-bound serine protease (ClpP class)